MESNNARWLKLGIIGIGLVVLAAVLIARRSSESTASTTNLPPSPDNSVAAGYPTGELPTLGLPVVAAPDSGPAGESPAGDPTNVDERAKAVLEKGLGNEAGRPPAGDTKALNQFLANHSVAEADLIARLNRAGQKSPKDLEGLFALRRKGASEATMKAYAREHVQGLAARAVVYSWIDRQLGKPPVTLPPPGSRKSMELGTLEHKGKIQ
ncbi:MAG TPA: hypothetical protein VGG33_20000 [Polyangia bacterium]